MFKYLFRTDKKAIQSSKPENTSAKLYPTLSFQRRLFMHMEQTVSHELRTNIRKNIPTSKRF